jgi:hypothetical protein
MDFGIHLVSVPNLVSQFETAPNLNRRRGISRNREFAPPPRHRIPDFMVLGRLDFLLSHGSLRAKASFISRVHFPYLSWF